ncbi:universal stress protein [Faunimonas sp. B44]|uniref:universal stress protein n=1 Tax=Faunimonas sp. B44 TaxID=3461493 RepID=UPI004044017C
MTRKMIALIDGSIYSESVCNHAAWIASRTGLAVELMHVLGRRETASGDDLSGSIALGARSALLQELTALDERRAKLAVQRGRAILDDAKAILDKAGVAASIHLRHGDLLEAIAEKEAEAELLLIGKRGEAADFAKGHLGSNLERVMRAVSKPLFVASRAFRPIERVLVAYDGSASAMRALKYVAESPLYRNLSVKVVTAGTATEAVQKGLADAQAVLAGAGIEAESAILPGPPDEALGRLVEDGPFGHLVMGASGHSRLRALFVGSTSLEMLRSCRVPILLVR